MFALIDHDNLLCGVCGRCAACELLFELQAVGLEPLWWEERLLIEVEMDEAWGRLEDWPGLAAMDAGVSGSWFEPECLKLVGI